VRSPVAICALVLAFPATASATLTSPPLTAAVPHVRELAPKPARGAPSWHGRLAHLAGTSHYDAGEWIYEDYPYSAYGAATVPLVLAEQLLATLGDALPQAQRLPGGLNEFQPTVGAGPLADEADISELRLAVRGKTLYVRARTTAMRANPRTALLLLFDTGRSRTSREIPFASSLRSARADVAALVTPAGTRIADLLSGATTDAPANADPSGYVNTLETRLPLDRVATRGEIRFAGAAGLVAPKAFTLTQLSKVTPRREPADQAVPERAQALALAARDIDTFFTTVSLKRLRRGDRERLTPGTGYSIRTFVAPAARSKSEGGTDGTLRDYGLYVPPGYSGAPAQATLLLRGSGMTAHSLPAVTPGILRDLGGIVVSPSGRSGFDVFSGAAYADTEQALADARTIVAIDPDRTRVAGYSMGGYATYLFAATRPDEFSAAFVVEGPVGGIVPATKTPIVNALVDVIPMLSNLEHTPIVIYQGTHDANVPILNGLTASDRLRSLGFRYRLDVLPGDHFTPGIIDDYSIGARYIARRRQDAPQHIRFTRDMTFEHRIDIGDLSDQPLAGKPAGLRFDHAWFVSRLEAADARAGKATIDVRTLARPAVDHVKEETTGVDNGVASLPAVFHDLAWTSTPTGAPLRNAFEATLTGAAAVTLNLDGMGLNTRRTITAVVRNDHPLALRLVGRHARFALALESGEHHLELHR